MDDKRILVLTTDAYGGYGGIALYNRDFISALCTMPGCSEVVAIPRIMPNALDNNLPEKLTYVTDGLHSKIKYIFTLLRILRKDSKFDLIVCGHINLLPLAYLAGAWLKKPVILFIYGIDVWQPTKSSIINALVKKITFCVSISEITKIKFIKWAGLNQEKVLLLPNAIHLSNYGKGDKDIKLLKRYGLKDKKVVMTLGRMSENERYKGFDEIIEIVPELIQKVPNIVYLIVGDGTDRQRLERKVKTLGIEKYVIFAGFVTEAEKSDHYRLADAYVMPSYGEGFGFVFLEALACGIPVIASKVDGGREAVRNGKLGVLVDPKNPEELKSEILRILEKSKHVPQGVDYFSYPNFEQRVHQVFTKMVGG
jgi:glycosyltransferase involved in cell wall biosynthesis